MCDMKILLYVNKIICFFLTFTGVVWPCVAMAGLGDSVFMYICSNPYLLELYLTCVHKLLRLYNDMTCAMISSHNPVEVYKNICSMG